VTHPTNLHIGQVVIARSRDRVTLVTAGQGGGKTSGAYEWIEGMIDEFPGESGLIGFPDFGLLNRVVLDVSDPERPTIIDFLTSIGQQPKLHVMGRYIECKDTKIFFVSGNDLVGFEGSHVKWAWIDEFDECRVGAYKRAYERTNMARGGGHVLLTGTPRNVRWCKQEITSRIGMALRDMGSGMGVARGNGFLWLQFPSSMNPAYDLAAIEDMRNRLPPWEFERIYLGKLSDMAGGNLYKREWWQKYSELPDDSQIAETVQFWDTAFKAKTSNDYSVCATWARTHTGQLYVIDVLRQRLEWPDLLRTAIAQHHYHNPSTVRIEDRASGQSLIQELRVMKLPVIAVAADQDKWRRASAGTGLVEAGLVHIPDYADWTGEFIEEHAQFSPDDKHEYDDQVDTTSMALNYFKPRLLQGGRSQIISESKASSWAGRGYSAGEPPGGLTIEGSGKIMGERRVSKWR